MVARLDESGIAQRLDELELFIAWKDLAWIVAYKKDCFTVDDIRLVFSDGKSQIELSESAQSIPEANVVLAANVSLAVPDWYERLMVSPAFEATPTIVYRPQAAIGVETRESTS
ncbi:hypothetical protein HDF16_000043 [Granulicella aggregans]|uniref:Uncharacterized protein n=1 Tax=Granulicella aggregans TaxID=474949 RepID=A0A7W7Z8P3_9BACT|nr:hypothetical protein [Granulicella aggregans]MBB5055374.1 hypothetical protein [Granulicella aggregans]